VCAISQKLQKQTDYYLAPRLQLYQPACCRTCPNERAVPVLSGAISNESFGWDFSGLERGRGGQTYMQ
jgi:hypothetical protein